tara:strand:+ start:1793 stop:4381 length:2589 start_codon:yes stop_codon:yes gene_type:complete
LDHTLVIVESPTKAKTIRKFLPSNYEVLASMGHVRDLPKGAAEIPAAVKKEKWSRIGVNTTEDFEPLYIVPKDKKKVVKELRNALKDATQLLLATDEDREGESISWHLLQILKPKIPTKRMVFHEITKKAINKALDETRDIDMELVQAQETRRILDRLFGYELSPLLWKKVAPRLSAGRVQSVSVRLLVKKERERRAFKKSCYWGIKASLVKDKINFESKLFSLNGQKISNGSDFDEQTGKLKKGNKSLSLGEDKVNNLLKAFSEKPWKVSKIEKKPSIRRPVPPFTTSTLQQEANRKLRLSARETMRCAQGLYERGFITYMRTDSVHLSEQAIRASRECVSSKYGNKYLSNSPRQFSSNARNAQEAHEAIRPAGEVFKIPNETNLSGRDLSLYDLIWKRTVASQMADARLTMINAEICVGEGLFKSSGKSIDFAGFFRAYVEGSDDPNSSIEEQEVILPNLISGECLEVSSKESTYHETKPPARYTEAALVKVLEKEGIGRPSTYASIIGTIVDRGYANISSNSLSPTFTAFAVTALLEEHFPDLVDTTFTAKMESSLDEISSGNLEWLPYLETFYKGKNGLEVKVQKTEGDIDGKAYRQVDFEDLPCVVRIGSNGPWLEGVKIDESGNEIQAKGNLPMDISPGDLDEKKVDQILSGPSDLGTDPKTGEKVFLRFGPYGPYVQLGNNEQDKAKPRRASLPKELKTDDLTLEDALVLLSLPKLLGAHPDGGIVEADRGRFGPYIRWLKNENESENRSLKKEDDVFTVDLERALEILAMPKMARGGQEVIKDFGKPKEFKDKIQVLNGRYGVYVKCGKTNVSLPKDIDLESFSIEDAILLLEGKMKNKKSKTSNKKTFKKKQS